MLKNKIILQVIDKYKGKAKEFLSRKNAKEYKDFLINVFNYANKNRDALKGIWKYLVLMQSLLKEYYKGTYKAIPTRSVIAIVAGLLYLINPFDIIPDYIPVIGLLDDIKVLQILIKQIKTDLDTYEKTRSN